MKNFLLLLALCALSANVFAQVMLDFTASPRAGCGQLLTTFTLTITGNVNPIVTWDWDFGDAVPNSSDPSPGHLYLYNPTLPCYTVTLRATDAAGVVHTKTKTNYICVYAKPTANYTAAPNSATLGCAPLTVQLLDASDANGGNIVAWQWSSNGGTPSLVGYGGSSPPLGIPNPTFMWDGQGTYAPALTVTDNNGCKATIQRNAFVTVVPRPQANFTSTAPNSCTEPHTVSFTNTTNAPAGTTYKWLINGNTYLGLTPPPQTFTAGIYDITLIVIGGNGSSCNDTIVKPAYINVGGNFNFSFTPNSGCTGTSVTFTPPVGSTDWVWDFCDGQGTVGDPNPSHTFVSNNMPQCCYPKLTATLPGGCRTTITSPTPICVSSIPAPNFTIDNSTFCSLPATVNFSTTQPSNPNIICVWNMGSTIPDTRNSCGNQTKTYTASDFVNGIVNPTLTWTDTLGCSGSYTLPINYRPLNANFTLSKAEGCVPYTSNIAVNTPPVFGSANTFNWFLDGVPYHTGNLPPAYTFASVTPCTHNFKLVVSNTLGCSDSITRMIKGGAQPTAVLSFSPNSTCAQFPVVFNVSASTANPSPCPLDTKMLLNFADNANATAFTTSPISHIYQDTISMCRKKPYLIVYSNGCASDTARAGCVTVFPSIAKFEGVR